MNTLIAGLPENSTSRYSMNPDEFSVTDDHREYCLARGWPPTLPDVFLPRFRQWWKDLLKDGRKPQFKSADRAFMSWIRRSSPLSEMPQFYDARQWETDISKAKLLEIGERKREPDIFQPAEAISPELARQFLNRAMELLRR